LRVGALLLTDPGESQLLKSSSTAHHVQLCARSAEQLHRRSNRLMGERLSEDQVDAPRGSALREAFGGSVEEQNLLRGGAPPNAFRELDAVLGREGEINHDDIKSVRREVDQGFGSGCRDVDVMSLGEQGRSDRSAGAVIVNSNENGKAAGRHQMKRHKVPGFGARRMPVFIYLAINQGDPM